MRFRSGVARSHSPTHSGQQKATRWSSNTTVIPGSAATSGIIGHASFTARASANARPTPWHPTPARVMIADTAIQPEVCRVIVCPPMARSTHGSVSACLKFPQKSGRPPIRRPTARRERLGKRTCPRRPGRERQTEAQTNAMKEKASRAGGEFCPCCRVPFAGTELDVSARIGSATGCKPPSALPPFIVVVHRRASSRRWNFHLKVSS